MRHAKLTALAAALALAALAVAAAARARQPETPTLEARAVLPADTFAPGPVSGTLIGAGPFNGRTPPFPSQPVQGISAILDGGGDSFWAMPDNGYGAKGNSADFLLRLYHVTPHFETASGGSGAVEVGEFVQLRDPAHRIPFPIVNGGSAERPLTGADFDIESVRRAKGDYWFGDEFGPFLLHVEQDGTVLDAPIPLPGVKSPQNPFLAAGETPNLGSSRGFEGMAVSRSGKTLYPMLEGALTTDPDPSRRFIYEFDVESKSYTGRRWEYRMEAPGYSIGDFTPLDGHRFLVIERDNLQGQAAAFKRVFVIDLREVGADGFLVKRQVVDLLHIADPALISLPARPGDIGLGAEFAFPFQTIESILPLGGNKLLLANDNNYPFSAGRNASLPDDDELIVLAVPDLR